MDKNTDIALYDKILDFKNRYPDGVIIIYGPTATGKSSLSLRLADSFAKNWQKVEIISADSRQVYKYMDIGTDKISLEDRQKVQHHIIDIINPDGEYTANQRQQDTKKLCSDIIARGNIPMIVGWTGLYIDTIYKNFSLPPEVKANRERRTEIEERNKKEPWYARNLLHANDPDTASEFHPANIRYIIRAIEIFEQTGIPKSVLAKEHPVDKPLLMISLRRPTEIANKLISRRVEQMIEQGLVDEVKSLLQRWYSPNLQSMSGIGYRQTIEVLGDKFWVLSKEELKTYNSTLITSITLASVQYAQKQRTWFRRYEKDALNAPKDRVEYIQVDL